MQLRRKIKRLAALVLAMNMALGCMPVGAWAEATTPTDLPPIIATDGEAMPEPTLPSDEQEVEKEDDAPALEESEAPDESHGDSDPAVDDPGSEQGESAENNIDEMPADDRQSDEEQKVPPDEPVAEEGPVEADEEEQAPDEETVPNNRLPIQAALDEHGHVYVATVHKQSVKQLIAQNQGVENTELADRNEAKSFDRYARQYGVDYAIQKGFSQDGKPRYILYFKARDRSAINQAMAAYSVAWARQQKQERSAAEPVLDPTREAPGKKVERIRQKGMER